MTLVGPRSSIGERGPAPHRDLPTLYQARWVLPCAFVRHEGGGLVVSGGRVVEVLEDRAAVRARRSSATDEFVDLGSVALAPGLVNAHAHLELGGLAGRIPTGGEFLPWVGAVLRERAGLTREDYARAVRAGAAELIATGTTCVGDVDSSGAAAEELLRSPLRARVYREVLDAGDPARTPAQLAALEEEPPQDDTTRAGYSPHAPHTVSSELLRACVRKARECGHPLSLHWAETREEREWTLEGGGPFAAFLGAPPGCSGLEFLRAAGALGPRTSLVHANHPEVGELELVARAGAVLVHCAGTHAYFGRERAPLASWVRSGATVALGSDSRASNERLDMRREMALVRAAHPELAPATVLDWATRGGARALGFDDDIGELSIGKSADFVAFELSGLDSAADPVDTITGARPAVAGSWIGGCAN